MITISRGAVRAAALLVAGMLAPIQSVSAQDSVLSPADRVRAAARVQVSAAGFANQNRRLQIPSDAAISFGVADSFTLEAWIKVDAFDEPGEAILVKDGSYGIRRSGQTGQIAFVTKRGAAWDELPGTAPVTPGRWFHLAAVYNGSTKEKRLYLDGVLNASQVITGLVTSTNPLQFGGGNNPAGTLTFFGGSLDSLRLWSHARGTDQIRADIDRDLTIFNGTADRSVPGLLGEWRFNGTPAEAYRDSSGNGRHATAAIAGSPPAAVDGLFFRPAPPLATIPTAALNFPGTAAARVTVADQPMLDLTNAVTLEAWINPAAFDKPSQAIITKGEAWGLTRFGSTSRIAFRSTHGGVADDLAGATSLLPGRWYHVAATWDGVTKRVYVDGVLDAKADRAGALDLNNDALAIGGNAAVNDREFHGVIDEVRVWALARSAEQLDGHRRKQLRGFENGLRGVWNFDLETAGDSSYVGAHGVADSGVSRVEGLEQEMPAEPVANVPPPAGGALYFRSDLAVKSSVVLPLDPRLNLTGALTVEAWISLSSYAGKPQGIVTKGRSWALLVDATTGLLNFQTLQGSEQVALRTTGPLGLNDWHHVAAVFDGSTKRLYVDGELQASAGFVGPLVENPLESVVFSGNSQTTSGQVSLHGRLDSVRIWSDARTPEEILAESVRELRGTEQGIVGAWRFNDAGAPGFDSSWHRLHGSPGGQPADYAPFHVSGLLFGPPPDGMLALDFNRDPGDADCVTISSASTFGFDSRMSLETWVYIDAVPGQGQSYALISKGSSAWELTLEDSGKINFHTAGVELKDTPGEPFADFFSTNRIEPGVWTHVAVVWDGTGDLMIKDSSGATRSIKRKEIYFNGQLDNSRDDLAGSIGTNGLPVLLGARPLVAAGAKEALYHGILDEVRIWNVPLPGEQIRSVFDNKLYGSERGLVGYWPFSEGGRNVDGSESMEALDQTLNSRVAFNGNFCPGMGILNRVDGVPLGEPEPLQYALWFNGVDEFVEVASRDRFTTGGSSLTIEAWVMPEGSGMRTILMQGDLGFGLAIDGDNRLRYIADGDPDNSLASAGSVTSGVWQHVAVVVDGTAHTTTFYINGLPVGSHPESKVTVKPGEPLVIGKMGTGGGSFFAGGLDEIRVWTVARKPAEIDLFALQSLPEKPEPNPGLPPKPDPNPGLVAYWQFNEGRGQTAGNRVPESPAGLLNVHMDDSNWRSGHLFEGAGAGESFNLTSVPVSAGLWVGTIALNRVNEVQTALGGSSTLPTATGDTLTLRILLHVDAVGVVRLLKDVVVMRTPAGSAVPPPPRRLVLLTNPALIPQFEGVVERSGKLVGQRFGTVDFDFTGFDLPLLGGIGPGVDALGKITLGKNHPTNPFRHKYHPQHRHGYEITRQFVLSFDTAPADPATANPGYGTEWLNGEYQETLNGLHKIPLKTAGRFLLTRLNEVNTLNQ